MHLYSEEWIAEFNQAVAGLEPGVSFRMLQVVLGSPEGTLHLALAVHEGRVILEQVAEADAELASEEGEPAFHVSVALHYDDALALARGEVDPARLLAAGRVRVRGDLSVLVRAQALLSGAAARLGSPPAEATS